MPQHYISHRLHDSYINVLVAALLLGFFLPTLFAPFNKYATFLLQGIFFLSSLKISFHAIHHEIHQWKSILLATLFMLLILPIISYSLALYFLPEIALPLLLLAAMPAGMTSPLLTSLIKGNVPLSLLLTITTSFLAPLTVPFILSTLLGSHQVIAINHMFTTLLLVIFLPFILAQAARFILKPRTLTTINPRLKALSFALMCLLFASITATYSSSLKQNFTLDSLTILLGMLLFFILVHLVTYVLFQRKNVRDRLTFVLCITYMNFTLAIYIAQQFFPHPQIVFFTLLSIVPWNIGIILFRIFSLRFLSNSPA